MFSSWKGNTVRAGKWLASTAGIFALFATSIIRSDTVGHIMLALCAILAFATTYYSVAAMRCKLATKKDFWAGFVILVASGAIFLYSTVTLLNANQ